MSCAGCKFSGREKASECPGCLDRFEPDKKDVVVDVVDDRCVCICGYDDPAGADVCPNCDGLRAVA